MSSEAIREILTRKPLSDEALERFADTVARLEADGHKMVDVFPLGTINPDAATATFHVNADRAAELVRSLSEQIELRPEIRLFPKGIIDPYFFEVQATIGNQHRG